MNKYQHINHLIISCTLICVLISCTSKDIQKQEIIFTATKTYTAPIVISQGEPIVTLLDTCLQPQIFAIPKPEVKPAGFFVTMQNFNTDRGLALSSLLCGLKDDYGRLWFGTSGNGVNVYDGEKFITYNSSHGLVHNLIDVIFQDESGIIWFGTYGGLSKYDGKSFANFTTQDGLINNDVSSITQDKEGALWIGTAGGVSRFDGTKFVNYSIENGLPFSNVNDLLMDNNENLLIATNQGVYQCNTNKSQINENEIVPYFKTTTNSNKPAVLKDARINKLFKDSNGRLWVGTDIGLFRSHFESSETQTHNIVQLTTKDGLINDQIQCITEDVNGNIWVGTPEGISRFDIRNNGDSFNDFYNLTIEQGLSNNDIRSITVDGSSSLWFGTYGGGLDRYDGKAVASYSVKQGLPYEVIGAISPDMSGNLWLGNLKGGLTKYDEQSFFNYSNRQGFQTNEILVGLNAISGALWFGSDHGVYKIHNDEIINYTNAQGLLGNRIVSLLEDKLGNIWLGSYEKGICKFNGKSFKGYTIDQGLVHNTVWSLIEDSQGNIWMATRGGLSIYDGNRFINYTKNQGLVENKLSKIFIDRNGNLIIGSWGSGISFVTSKNVDKLITQTADTVYTSYFKSFTSNNGLANDVVYDIKEDSHGNIFIGSSFGLTVLKGGIDSTGVNIAKHGIEHFNEKSGYPIKDLSNNFAMYIDKEDVLWAGTGDKLIRFDYKNVFNDEIPPTVLIHDVKVNNEKVNWVLLQKSRSQTRSEELQNVKVESFIKNELDVYGKILTTQQRDSIINKFENVLFDDIHSEFNVPVNLVLPFAQNNISIDFVGIETSRPDLVQYQYMLEGYDKDWNPVTNQASAHFGNISEGRYTFKLKAKSPDNVWSEPLSYEFKVLSPWYRSWFAYIFYGILGVAGFVLIDRYQRGRILTKERQRSMKLELAQAKEIEKAYKDLKGIQSQLIQAEKMASLGELTAGVAHEIQNPLNFINNFSELNKELIVEMKEEIDNQNFIEVKAIAVDIEANEEKIGFHGKRVESIVKGMLQHSRISGGIKEPTNINALCDEFLRLAYHGLRAKDKSFNADLITDFDQSIKFIQVIPQDIGRVILNLMTNAFYAVNVKASLAKSLENLTYKPTVSVSTRRIFTQKPASIVRNNTSKINISGIDQTREGPMKVEEIEIKISDNGVGIPKDVLDKIFQPFFTTKPSGQGTGLGLSLSFDIIKAHNGEMKVETFENNGQWSENTGTAFIIKLPKST